MSAFAKSPGKCLEELVVDSSTSEAQKLDCLKLLKVVVKNLADPIKAKDPKYRQLKLENEKVQAKILPLPCAVDYLKSIGFSEAVEDGEKLLRIESVEPANMNASLQEMTNAIGLLTPQPNKKARVETPSSSSSSSTTKLFVPPSKLSEKQKARELLEEKERKEKEETRRQRAKNIALLKRDKYVRQNDENWKSGVSAAMAKTGNSISTFRDRHGEN